MISRIIPYSSVHFTLEKFVVLKVPHLLLKLKLTRHFYEASTSKMIWLCNLAATIICFEKRITGENTTIKKYVKPWSCFQDEEIGLKLNGCLIKEILLYT